MAMQIICGIEIEAEYNSQNIGVIPKNPYKSQNSPQPFGEYFIAESDCSLRNNTFGKADTVEFISKPFLIEDTQQVLTQFKNEITNRATQKSLKDCLSFNNTTGAHIHISILNNKSGEYIIQHRSGIKTFVGQKINFKKRIVAQTLNNITTKIAERVSIIFPHIAEKFNQRIYRNYSAPMNNIDYYSRRMSWNCTLSDEHIEFRSFHLYGVNKWSEMFGMYEIAMTIIKEEFQKLYNLGFPINEIFEIKSPQIIAETNINETITISKPKQKHKILIEV